MVVVVVVYVCFPHLLGDPGVVPEPPRQDATPAEAPEPAGGTLHRRGRQGHGDLRPGRTEGPQEFPPRGRGLRRRAMGGTRGLMGGGCDPRRDPGPDAARWREVGGRRRRRWRRRWGGSQLGGLAFLQHRQAAGRGQETRSRDTRHGGGGVQRGGGGGRVRHTHRKRATGGMTDGLLLLLVLPVCTEQSD